MEEEPRAQRGVLKIKFLLMSVVNTKFMIEFHGFQLCYSRNVSWLGDIFVGLLLTGEQNWVKFCFCLGLVLNCEPFRVNFNNIFSPH